MSWEVWTRIRRRYPRARPRHGTSPGLLLRPGGGQDVRDQGVVEALERGPDLLLDRGAEVRGKALAIRRRPARAPADVRERGQQGPRVGRAVEQLLEDRDRAVTRGPAGHTAVAQAVAQRRQVAVREHGHRAPASHHVAPVRRRLQALVVGDQEQVRRHALQGIDVPVGKTGVELGDVRGDGLAQRREGDRVLAGEPLRRQGR